VKMYDSLGELQRQLTEGDKGDIIDEIRPGQKIQKEITWEVSGEVSELQMEFDGTVLVRKLGEDLVNGPITVVSQRRGGKEVYFSLGKVNND
ncbi:MAG: hypothetical protein ACYC2T_13550, partial [Bacillota bacterium]